MEFKPIPVEYTRGELPFTLENAGQDKTMLDFWAWAYSDVLTNTARGVLAEFVVAMALDLDIRKPRTNWDEYDLEYRGHGVEVKSASYHQRWAQEKMSSISFGIPRRRGWNDQTNEFKDTAERQADIYVLALLAEKERVKVNPLNLDQWKFWAIETRFFDERKRSQHSITFNSLIKERGEPVGFQKLKHAVDSRIDAFG